MPVVVVLWVVLQSLEVVLVVVEQWGAAKQGHTPTALDHTQNSKGDEPEVDSKDPPQLSAEKPILTPLV